MIQYAEVVLNIPFPESNSLTYEINPNQSVSVGKRVEVQIQNKKEIGVVVEIHSLIPNYKTKEILRVIDKEPVINAEQLELAKWMSEFYLASLGECLFKMLPQGKRNISIDISQVEVERNLLELNEEQNLAYTKIKNDFGKEAIHLLYGITGSGKTEVYIHLINELLNHSDSSALFLVPEISLTVQTLKRLQEIFGNSLALLHSAMKISEKFRNYLDILKGKKRIIIGTRSAIFAPAKNLGLIILDEEHDTSYKEHSAPRYHARQIAMQRAKTNQAVVVLGSATPSIETYYYSLKNKIVYHKLSKRAKSSSLPKINLQVKSNDKEIISDQLLFKIKQKLDKKEQVVLLLNRRGYSPLIYSKVEEKVLECPNCTTHLCYHNKGKAVCHLCGYSIPFSELKKMHPEIELMGTGTQKLEEYILEKFPTVKLERLDQDSTKNKQVVTEVIQKLIKGQIDILTGTQMIAKGLDASKVSLVGVVDASIGLGLPDFRAGERVYSLLTQVAGRAGRAEIEGEVLIETNSVNHPIIQLAKNQNYEEFFNSEILYRKDAYFPPFCRLVRLVLRSKNEEKLQTFSVEFKKYLDKELDKYTFQKLVILGPTEAPFYKIDSNFRIHLIIKTLELTQLREVIKELKKFKFHKSIYLEIDIDPIDLV